MAVAGSENLSLRPSAKPLAWSLLISLALHIVALVVIPGVYFLVAAMVLAAAPKKPPLQPKNPQKNEMVMEELPLVFVDVDPSQAMKETPKNAKYYSSQNIKAANPDAQIEANTPKINGTQLHVPRTETVQKAKSIPLQPAPPKDTTQENTTETKRKSGQKIGDLALAKPSDKPDDTKTDAQLEESKPKHVRPRTITEAQVQKHLIPGEKMKQDGGVKSLRITPSFDTKATAFGAYDAAFIRAVQEHWNDLVDSQRSSPMRTGRVVLEFNLNYDGRITDMKVIDTDVDDLLVYLCQRAILDPMPFEKWPSDMRRIIGSDRRQVHFTFYYE